MGFYQLRPSLASKAGATAALCGLLAAGGLPTLAQSSLAAPSQAELAPLTGKTVSLDVAGADLHVVVGMLQRSTQMEFAIQDGDKPFKTVTVGLHDAPLAKALRTIAFSAGATVAPNEDGVYVFRPLAASAAAAPDALQAADDGAPSTPYPAATPVADLPARHMPANMTWHKLTLQHAVPSEVLKIMHWDRDLRVLDPYDGMQDHMQQNVSTTGGDYVATYGQEGPPAVPIGRGNSGAGDQANRSVEPQAQAQQAPIVFPGTVNGGFQGGGFNPGGFQGGGFNGGGFQRGGGFQGGGFQPGGGFQGGNGQNQQQLPEGVDRIYALEGDNSLLVEATPDGFNNVRNIVKNLDIAPRQVQIKVEFVTASVTDVDSFGINFNLVPYPGISVANNNGSQANTSSVPQTVIQFASGNIVAQLYASLVEGRGKVVQAPLITTTNNVPANITVSTQIPFVTTTNVVGNGQTTSNTQQGFLPINTGLQVIPRINSDDTVTLRLNPQISDIAGSPSIAGGPPPTTTQRLTTLRTVRSGETMVLGGLVRKSDSVSQSRIPILGDLPVIGSLFRNRVKNVSDSELLIFVTPTIIGESSEGQASSAGPNVSVAP